MYTLEVSFALWASGRRRFKKRRAKLIEAYNFSLTNRLIYSCMKFLLRNIRIGKWSIPVPVLLWFLAALAAALSEIARGILSINNYLIYTGVFDHSVQQVNLYAAYPDQYFDSNHYGPTFSLLIAPFAWMPVWLGCLLWCIANAAVLFYAIEKLPFNPKQKNLVLLIGMIEMMTAMHNVQFNTMLTGWMVLVFVLVEEEKDFWATLFIAAGMLLKIYGIVGLAFFCFSKHRVTFVFSFVFWTATLICIPMIWSSPKFIVQSYRDWYQSLVEKNEQNTSLAATGLMQDVSVMGMIGRIFRINEMNNLWVLAPAAALQLLPFFRFKQYRNLVFRITVLCSTLIAVVIFSSSAESPTFVIAVTGIAIWYVVQYDMQPAWKNGLIIFVLLLTCLSATDFFPAYIRVHYVRTYSLKALPCFVLWCVMAWQLLFKDFTRRESAKN